MRKIAASNEVKKSLKRNKQDKVEITAFFFIDPPNEKSNNALTKLRSDIYQMSDKKKIQYINENPLITSPLVEGNPNLKRYAIRCNECGEVQGVVMAEDSALTNWCDFHYYQWSDGNEWRGCFAPHVSPITGELCLECCCGQDTRDFTLNKSLPKMFAEQKERENKVGRQFGRNNSKFRLEELN